MPAILGRIARQSPAPQWARPPAPGRVRELIYAYGASGGFNTSYFGFLQNATGETAEMRREYPKMAFKEGSIKSPLLARVWSVASSDVQVLPKNKKSTRDQEVAAGYRHALMNSHMGIPNIVAEIGLAAAIQGEVLCEMPLNDAVETRGQPPPDGWLGKRMIRAVKAKHPSTYQIQRDRFGNPTGVLPASGRRGVNDQPWPMDRFIYYSWLSLYGEPQSDLRASYRAYQSKEMATQLRRLLVEKLVGGIVWLKNVTREKQAEAIAALQQLRSDSVIATEQGQELQIVDKALSSPEVFKAYIDDQDREMMVGVSGAHLPFQEGQTPGARGKTDVQRGVAQLAEWKLSADLGHLLTRASALWVDENYRGADLPTVQFGGVDQATVLQDAKIFTAAHAIVPLSAEQIYERLNVSPPNGQLGDAIAPVAPKLGGPGAAGDPTDQFADRGEWYLDAAGTELGATA